MADAPQEYLRLGRNAEDRQGAYRQLFRTAVSNDALQAIRDCTHKGWALGGKGSGKTSSD